jgi:predicted transcriptional regulator
MIASIAAGSVRSSVQSAMRQDFPVAWPDEALQPVFTRLHERDAATAPILENGRLVGLITRENIAEYMMVHTALAQATNDKKGGEGQLSDELLALVRESTT